MLSLIAVRRCERKIRPPRAGGRLEVRSFRLKLAESAYLAILFGRDFLFDRADRVTVMKNGQVVGTGRVEDMTKDEALAMIILGKCPPGAIPGPGAMAN